MDASKAFLVGCCLMMLVVCGVSAMSPPAWIQPGTRVTYQAALTPYYAIDSDDPMERWVHYEGTGVYGYVVDTITTGDGYGYSGDSVVISGIDGSTLYASSWSYQQGDPGMGLVPFWVDLDGIAFGPETQVIEGPIELAGTVWNARVYYYANLGTSFDVRYVVDADSGIVLVKNAGLTGANNQMQREIYILQSIETAYPGSGLPDTTSSNARELEQYAEELAAYAEELAAYATELEAFAQELAAYARQIEVNNSSAQPMPVNYS